MRASRPYVTIPTRSPVARRCSSSLMISSARPRLSAGIERERSATTTTSTPLPPSGASGTAASSARTARTSDSHEPAERGGSAAPEVHEQQRHDQEQQLGEEAETTSVHAAGAWPGDEQTPVGDDRRAADRQQHPEQRIGRRAALGAQPCGVA